MRQNEIFARSFFSFRIKERSHSEMERDLSARQIFDMTIELKHIAVVFPENGLYRK